MSDNKDYSQYINRLRIPDFKSEGFLNEENEVWDLHYLKPINFFIGANNSGKSRLIRHLFINELADIDSDKLPIKVAIDQCTETSKPFECPDNQFTPKIMPNIRSELLNKSGEITISNFENYITSIASNVVHKIHQTLNENSLDKFVRFCQDQIKSSDDYNFLRTFENTTLNKIYIPLLRGLRTLSKDDSFKGRTISDYFNGSHTFATESEEIFTGHSLYEDLKNSLLGSYEERGKIREFELYLSKHFFNNQALSLVPRVNDNVVHFKEGDKAERPIYDLGDGLQAIIILTFKVFMANKPTMFFIEEPEQHLHASMQRALVEAFSSHPEHMYFITTHSNHFIDLAQEKDDVGLQRVFQKIEKGNEITVIDNASRKTEILSDMGVRASSVLLANCSIWVEGITDKLYIRTYMAKFMDELEKKGTELELERVKKLRNYKENLHYIFTEYQGSNITHWNFDDEVSSEKATHAKSMTKNILLIADADIEGKGDRVETLSNALSTNFHLLEYKEIENYLPQSVMIKTAKLRWETFNNKETSKFIANNIAQNAYSNGNGIGSYLESFVSDAPKERKFFEAQSGTIKDKVKFCSTAVSVMEDKSTTWKLTTELKELCEKIWCHIENSN